MDNSSMPERPGQICKIISDVPDMEAEEVYIITEDPAIFDADDEILVVGLKDLQRNVANPTDTKVRVDMEPLKEKYREQVPGLVEELEE